MRDPENYEDIDPQDEQIANEIEAAKVEASESKDSWFDELIPFLELVVAFSEPNPTVRYDAMAERFCRETGMMAPGKSVPLEMASSQPPDDVRMDQFKRWTVEQAEKVNAEARRLLGDLGADLE